VDGAKLSRVKRPYQIQLVNEPTVYPETKERFGRLRATQALYESFAPVHAFTGVALRNTDGPVSTFNFNVMGGPIITFQSRDTGFDQPYSDGDKADPIRAVYIRGDADWPRASSRQKVKSEDFGEREFGIYVDAYGAFKIFPTSQIEGLHVDDAYAQNVPETYVRRLRPTYPAWSYVPTMRAMDYLAATPNVGKWFVDQPELDIKFNSKGTRCTCIVFEREEYLFDAAFWAANASPEPMTSAKFDALKLWFGVNNNSTQAFGNGDTYAPARYFTAPGIVEIEIAIELTGPDANDYEATLKLTEIHRPSTSHDALNPQKSRCPIFVGYVWYDLPDKTNAGKFVKADTLVEVDIEYWFHAAGNHGQNTTRQTIIVVRNSKTFEELCSFVASPIMAVDLTTLSMVMKLDSVLSDIRSAGDGTPVTFLTKFFAAWVICGGKHKELIFPDGTPDQAKELLNSYTKTTGRDFLAGRITADSGGWEYMPIAHPKDGWVDTAINDYREWWAHDNYYWYDMFFSFIDPDMPGTGYVRYKTAASSPAHTPAMDDTQKWLSAVGGDFVNLFFCTSPRWGFQQYSTIASMYVATQPFNAFYTHPNGSYMFWDNGQIMDLNGMPADFVNQTGPGGTTDLGQGDGLAYTHNTLAIYDAAKVKHIIFDRVHFEMRAKGMKPKFKNTTFLELYNRAVERGVKDKTLSEDENIQLMKYEDMTANLFTKDIGDNTGFEYLFLDLKMSWDGADWWYQEGAWSTPHATSSQYPPPVGTSGNFNDLNAYNYWRRGSYASGSLSDVPGFPMLNEPEHWHIRFCNPLIIMEK
jgi:hypothetical protein